MINSELISKSNNINHDEGELENQEIKRRMHEWQPIPPEETIQYYKVHHTMDHTVDNLLIIDVDYALIQSISGHQNVDLDNQYTKETNKYNWIYRHPEWQPFIRDYYLNNYTILFIYSFKIPNNLLSIYRKNISLTEYLYKNQDWKRLLLRIDRVVNGLYLPFDTQDNNKEKKGDVISIIFIYDQNNQHLWNLTRLINKLRILPSKNSVYIGRKGQMVPIDQLDNSNNNDNNLLENNPRINPPNLIKSIIDFPYIYEVILLVGHPGSGKKNLAYQLKMKRNYLVMNSRDESFINDLLYLLKEKRHISNSIVINGSHPSVESRQRVISKIQIYNVAIRIFWLMNITKHNKLSNYLYHNQFEPPTASEGGYVIPIY